MNELRYINKTMISAAAGILAVVFGILAGPVSQAASAMFTVETTISQHNAYKWASKVTADPSDTVDIRVNYKNTDDAEQETVKVSTKLPSALALVNGSTRLFNNLNPKGKTLSNSVDASGVNLGAHSAGAQSFLVFTVKVAQKSELACGAHSYKIMTQVRVDDSVRSDAVTITTNKKCETPAPAPITPKPAQPKAPAAQSPVSTTTNVVPVQQIPVQATPAAQTSTASNASQDEQTSSASSVQAEKLPSTGPEMVISGLVGSSALGYSAYTYAQSRRTLGSIFKR